jgi:flagellar basal body-associated protein FliL
MKKQIVLVVIGVVVVIGLILGGMYVMRFFNAATLHTQVIKPKPGIECVVVSAADSTSVDCWNTL